ncbi:MAG: winged helix-turn-helix transcriptional regulator [Rhodobacter sp.]|nr:winged helix-turn-helix transcriptional regulator [Paracoccaceae bacterium]MCC0077585.1 winged helix-turn-helix transcriptional regulator [Rhodobacter sp.]
MKDFLDPLTGGPLNQALTFRLGRLHAKVIALAARLLEQTAGITMQQWRIFYLIDACGPVTAAEIQRNMDVDKALISRTVRRLIDEGLLASTPSKTDGRAQVLDFTAQGRAVMEKARPIMRARQEHIRAAFSDTEREQLVELMLRFEQAVDTFEVPGDRPGAAITGDPT